MEIHEIEKEIEVACISVVKFPDGIVAAHEKLHELLPYQPGREYYGISWGDGKGGIVYKAASTMLDSSEAAHPELEFFTIQKGKYLCEILENYQQNIPGIKAAFTKLLADPRIAPDGICLEANMIGKDLWCMVKLKD